MNWLKLAPQKAPLLRGTEVRREVCPHRIKVLSSFPKQKNKQYSTVNIQRTAHCVCPSRNNKSWNTAIGSGWLRTKLTLVLIEFGGLHTALMLQKLSSQLAPILQRSEPVVNLTSGTALAMARHSNLYCTCLGNKQIFCHSCEPRTKFTFFKYMPALKTLSCLPRKLTCEVTTL